MSASALDELLIDRSLAKPGFESLFGFFPGNGFFWMCFDIRQPRLEQSLLLVS